MKDKVANRSPAMRPIARYGALLIQTSPCCPTMRHVPVADPYHGVLPSIGI